MEKKDKTMKSIKKSCTFCFVMVTYYTEPLCQVLEEGVIP